jgi:hypothetical protein
MEENGMDAANKTIVLDLLNKMKASLPAPASDLPPGTKKKASTVRILATEEVIQAKASDPEVSARLQAYKALERPLEFAAMSPAPALSKLLDLAPHCAQVINDSLADAAFARRMKAPLCPPRHLLLWGPSGSGKTWLAKRLIEAMAPASISYSAAGVSSAVDFVGQTPTFRASDASLPVRAISRTKAINPAILVDEIDKAGSSDWNGDAKLALVPFTETESASRFFDPFLQVHVNCSWVTWVFTANEIDNIPEPLLNRLNVYKVQRPGPESLDRILVSFAQELARRYGLEPRRLPKVDDLLRSRLEGLMKKGASLREVRSVYESETRRRAIAKRLPVRRPAAKLARGG